MSGSELFQWLLDIWHDLMHLADADILALLVKLFVSGFALIVVWTLGAWILRGLWQTFSPLILFVWRVVTAPVWLPWRGVKRLVRAYRKYQERKEHEEWLRQQEEQRRIEAEQARLREISVAREREETARYLGLID